MRGTIAWSYDLLGDAEKEVFQRISVFDGGCTLEAAEHVCDMTGVSSSDGSSEGSPDVLTALAALVDANLILRRRENYGADLPESGIRLTMLETVKEYATELLIAGGRETELRARHTAFFLRLAEEAEPETYGSGE